MGGLPRAGHSLRDRAVSPDPLELTLRDGTTVEIRPIASEDRGRLERGFERLSERSRYTRFLAPMESLSPSMLSYLTDVDHHDHEALIALDPRSGDLIGVARYVRTGETAAEAAVTVADEWQGDGLGTGLTSLLAERALEEGIDRFTALLLAENRDMIGLLESLGEVTVTRRDGETMEVALPLEPDRPGAGKALYALLRAARRVALAVRSAGGEPPQPS